MVSENKVFFMLNELLTLTTKGSSNEIQKYIVSEMSKLPSNLKIFVVSKGKGNDEIICQTRKMAEEVYRNNLEFKEIYYFNPLGECVTIKARK